MTKKAKDNNISLYDEAINKNKAINDLSATFVISREEFKEILREYGRDVPYDRKKTKDEPQEASAEITQEEPKEAAAETTQEDPPEAAGQERHLPMPQYIVEVLTRELDCLDGQIEAVQQQLDDLNQRYTQIADFLIGGRP